MLLKETTVTAAPCRCIQIPLDQILSRNILFKNDNFILQKLPSIKLNLSHIDKETGLISLDDSVFAKFLYQHNAHERVVMPFVFAVDIDSV